MPPPSNAQVAALVQQQAASRARLTGQAQDAARKAVGSFDGWYDTDAITAWAAALAAAVEAVQTVIARSTDAHLAQLLTLLLGRTVRPMGAVRVAGLRKDITHAGAYGRVADAYRWQQAKADRAARLFATAPYPTGPPDLDGPVEAAVQRALAVADMDAQLAFRAQSQNNLAAAADKGLITGYRRVIHPELSRGGTCGLCIAASDRLYGPKELLPLHDRCQCTTVPVIDGLDPGSALNTGDLRKLYRAAGSTGRADLKKVRAQVDEHGELGPLLTPAGTRPRTARQARDDEAHRRRSRTAAEQRANIEYARDSLTPAADRARQLADTDPDKWGPYAQQLEDRVDGLTEELAA